MASLKEVYTKENFIKLCKEHHWESPVDVEFLGHFYDYVSGLSSTPEVDPLQLNELAASMENIDGGKQADRTSLFRAIQKAMEHPAYHFPDILRDSFKKVQEQQLEQVPEMEMLDKEKNIPMPPANEPEVPVGNPNAGEMPAGAGENQEEAAVDRLLREHTEPFELIHFFDTIANAIGFQALFPEFSEELGNLVNEVSIFNVNYPSPKGNGLLRA